jgi:large subunit ribosomal protein L10
MNKTNKTELAQSLKEKFSKANVAIFTEYKGLKAADADEFRRQLRAVNTEVKVLKNNIGRLIVKDGSLGNDAKELMDTVVGPTLVAFSYGDVAQAAKIIDKFSSTNEAVKVKTSLMGDKKITPADVAELANLPSREVLLAKMLGTMNAPVTNFVRVLAAVPRGLVTVLSAIEKKKADPSA